MVDLILGGMRFSVQTSLKADNWSKYLIDYFDQQLPDLIEFGFPLSFDRDLKLVGTFHNHPPVTQFIEHVDKYIQEELSHLFSLQFDLTRHFIQATPARKYGSLSK